MSRGKKGRRRNETNERLRSARKVSLSWEIRSLKESHACAFVLFSRHTQQKCDKDNLRKSLVKAAWKEEAKKNEQRKKNTHKEPSEKKERHVTLYFLRLFLENEVSVIFHILSILIADDWLTKRLFSDHFTNLTPHRPFDWKFDQFIFFYLLRLRPCIYMYACFGRSH